MALEVPVAIGLAVLFGRSLFDIATSRGEGFMDSFAGLVFFLLIGRLFQQKAFERLAFDRTYRSFLPLSVQVERGDALQATPIQQLQPGDCIVLRPNEVVPADAVLLDAHAAIDYAFVTGEQTPVAAERGDTIRAGGRVTATATRLRVLRAVSDSQLAALWNNRVFAREKAHWLTDIAARFGTWFTAGALLLAAIGAVAWWPDLSASFSVATAVLIIACPCALTLAAPITLGTAMGMLGRKGLYLKDSAVVLDMSRIDTVAFDKTGTLTASSQQALEHSPLSPRALDLVRRLASASVHPTSRALAASLPPGDRDTSRVHFVVERPGQAIRGIVDGVLVAIGSAAFVAAETGDLGDGPGHATFVAAGSERGWIRARGLSRPGVEQAAHALGQTLQLNLISGDGDGERARWEQVFGARMRFRQSPEDKLAFVNDMQADGHRVLMIGDGLNDAGALAAADVGFAVSDETACITPACDAVISGQRLADLPAFVAYARRARQVVMTCFIVSVLYNVFGLGLALAGALTPLASAILMPVSSLTIVGISSGAMRWAARRLPA
jgi:Cu+-exporting ATPase